MEARSLAGDRIGVSSFQRISFRNGRNHPARVTLLPALHRPTAIGTVPDVLRPFLGRFLVLNEDAQYI